MFSRLGLKPARALGTKPDTVSGRVSITRTWSLLVPGSFERTLEHGQLSFSRRGMTVAVTAYANPDPFEDTLLDRFVEAAPRGAIRVARTERGDGSRWLTYETREATFGGMARLTVVHAHAALGRDYVGLEIGTKDRVGLGSSYGVVASCRRDP